MIRDAERRWSKPALVGTSSSPATTPTPNGMTRRAGAMSHWRRASWVGIASARTTYVRVIAPAPNESRRPLGESLGITYGRASGQLPHTRGVCAADDCHRASESDCKEEARAKDDRAETDHRHIHDANQACRSCRVAGRQVECSNAIWTNSCRRQLRLGPPGKATGKSEPNAGHARATSRFWATART